MAVEIGSIYEGQVVKVLKYGAIVRLTEGISGLVHISEIADSFVSDVGDYLREGDTVKVKLTGEKEGGRYELSAKQAEPLVPHEGTPSAQMGPRPRPARAVTTEFEDRLGDFIKSSNQRLNELQRARNVHRRGGRK
jgi:S1 RNA binding domain protein